MFNFMRLHYFIQFYEDGMDYMYSTLLISTQGLTTSMEKKMAAQAGAPGSFRTTSGYVRKTSPGPLLTTWDT